MKEIPLLIAVLIFICLTLATEKNKELFSQLNLRRIPDTSSLSLFLSHTPPPNTHTHCTCPYSISTQVLLLLHLVLFIIDYFMYKEKENCTIKNTGLTNDTQCMLIRIFSLFPT